MRQFVIPAALICLQTPTAAQEAPPRGLAEMELERSRACVPVIARLDEFNASLAPFASRSQRLMAIAQAVALEERSVVDSLDTSDPVEGEVRAWFVADGELAQRYVAERSDALLEQRTLAREAIKQTVAEAIEAVQDEVEAKFEESADLVAGGASCDGAIFVRSAVLEACESESSPVCDEAAEPSLDGRFRFVASVEGLWDVEELRPWSSPVQLRVTPDGQLDGARTIGFARNGNIVASVAFSPLFRAREELTPDQISAFEAVNDSLGIVFDHPEITFAPALSIRASVPEPVAGESYYVVHFDTPEQADPIWTGPAGTGVPIEATLALNTAHLGRLTAGEVIRFPAIRRSDLNQDEVVYSIEFSTLGQAQATDALLGYMVERLSADLTSFVPPSG